MLLCCLDAFLSHQSSASVYLLPQEFQYCLSVLSDWSSPVAEYLFGCFFCKLLHFLPGYTCFIEVTAVVFIPKYFLSDHNSAQCVTSKKRYMWGSVCVVFVLQAKNINLTASVPLLVESFQVKLVNVSKIWVHCFHFYQWKFI